MKKFLLFLLGLIVLLAVGVTIFLLTFDLNSYRRLIEEKLTSALKRQVTIGQLEMKLSLIPTVKIRDIQISNPDYITSEKPLLKLDFADATLAIAPLFSKRIELQSIKAGNIDLYLTKRLNKNNWTFDKEKSTHEKAKADSMWQTRIDNVMAQKITVSYQDDNKNYETVISDFSLKQLKVFSMTTAVLGQAFKVTGTVDDLLKLINKEPDYSFNIEIVGVDSTIKLSGTIGDTTNFKNLLLNIEGNTPSLKQTLGAFGMKGRGIPAQSFSLFGSLQGDLTELKLTGGLINVGGNKLKVEMEGSSVLDAGLPVIDLSGRINLSDWSLAQIWGIRPFNAEIALNMAKEEVRLKKVLFRAGRTDMQVSGKVLLAQTIPTVDLTLESEYFGIQDILQSDEQHAVMAGEESDRVISDKPIQLDFLKRLNGKISLKLPHLDLTEKIVGYLGIDGMVSLNGGQLKSNDLQIKVLDGLGQLKLVLDAQSNQKIEIEMALKNLNLDKVKALNGVLDNAKLDIDLNLGTEGRDLKSLLSGLNGTIVAEIPQGKIVNEWFNNNVVETLGGAKKRSMNYSTADQVNELLCAALNLNIHNGVIRSKNNIALETPHVGFLIGGDINIPTEKVNLDVRPVLYTNRSAKVDSLLVAASQFIQISGTFTQFMKGQPNIERKKDMDISDVKNILSGMGQAKPQVYQLCQQVLGQPSKAQIRVEQKKTQMLPEPRKVTKPKVQKTPEEQFKQQFLESLTQVLQ